MLAWRDFTTESTTAVVSGGEDLTYIASSENGDTRSRVYLTAIDVSAHTLWDPIPTSTAIAPRD